MLDLLLQPYLIVVAIVVKTKHNKNWSEKPTSNNRSWSVWWIWWEANQTDRLWTPLPSCWTERDRNPGWRRLTPWIFSLGLFEERKLPFWPWKWLNLSSSIKPALQRSSSPMKIRASLSKRLRRRDGDLWGCGQGNYVCNGMKQLEDYRAP